MAEGAKRPILLPKGEMFASLIVENVHKDNLHSGVLQTLAGIRSKYWIPQCRSLLKAVLKKCSVCCRHEGGSYRMPVTAPLPASSVREASPFSRTGAD